MSRRSPGCWKDLDREINISRTQQTVLPFFSWGSDGCCGNQGAQTDICGVRVFDGWILKTNMLIYSLCEKGVAG